MTSRDAVILRKLWADGDGVGEEKRIRTLVTHLVALKDNDVAKRKRNLEKIRLHLSQSKMHMERRTMQERALVEQTTGFGSFIKKFEDEMVKSQTKIAECKAALVDARKVRQNKLQYDRLAKDVAKLPSRAETTSKIAQLDAQLAIHLEEQKGLEDKLVDRRQKLISLFELIDKLQPDFGDDERSGSVDEDVSQARRSSSRDNVHDSVGRSTRSDSAPRTETFAIPVLGAQKR